MAPSAAAVFAGSERTALTETLFGTEKEAAWGLKPVIEVKNPGKSAGGDFLRRFSVPLLILLANSVGTTKAVDSPFAGLPTLPRLSPIDRPGEFASSTHCYSDPVTGADGPAAASRASVCRFIAWPGPPIFGGPLFGSGPKRG